MTSRVLFLAACALCTSCGSSRPAVDEATLGHLIFAVPAGWQSRLLSDRYTQRIEWTPSDNATAKESVVIMQSAPRAALVRAPDRVAELLAEAQRNLPHGSFSTPSRFVTPNGLVGFEVAGEFVPPGKSERYQRLHAVLIDARTSTLVHVLYTAEIADREAFQVVVDSIHEGA